jgi:hypothetical protein
LAYPVGVGFGEKAVYLAGRNPPIAPLGEDDVGNLTSVAQPLYRRHREARPASEFAGRQEGGEDSLVGPVRIDLIFGFRVGRR